MHFQDRRKAREKNLAHARLTGQESANELGELSAAAETRDFYAFSQVWAKRLE